MADQGAEGLLSPILRTHRLRAARPHLAGDVLDFGCGSGSLAAYVQADCYIGVDRDERSLMLARRRFPNHRFVSDIDAVHGELFDTVVALAVIEHIIDPVDFLRLLTSRLADHPEAKIICTTPHPSMGWAHTVGAKIGFFSKHANEEHEDLLNCNALEKVGNGAGLRLVLYRRFLMGANQIAIFKR